jgi:hypothetical protein
VERVDETEHFHDSELDVYDLFNACDGVLNSDGFLDVEQLNHYSPDEAEELNVAWLRAVWEHTATGCERCAEIVEDLQTLRGKLRERSAKSPAVADINGRDSIS